VLLAFEVPQAAWTSSASEFVVFTVAAVRVEANAELYNVAVFDQDSLPPPITLPEEPVDLQVSLNSASQPLELILPVVRLTAPVEQILVPPRIRDIFKVGAAEAVPSSPDNLILNVLPGIRKLAGMVRVPTPVEAAPRIVAAEVHDDNVVVVVLVQMTPDSLSETKLVVEPSATVRDC